MATLTWKVLFVAPDTPIRDLGKSKKANRGDRVFNTTKNWRVHSLHSRLITVTLQSLSW